LRGGRKDNVKERGKGQGCEVGGEWGSGGRVTLKRWEKKVTRKEGSSKRWGGEPPVKKEANQLVASRGNREKGIDRSPEEQTEAV